MLEVCQMNSVSTAGSTWSTPNQAPARFEYCEVRLTARGRVALSLLALCAPIVGVVTLSGYSFAQSNRPATPTQVLNVQPGDTLWQLAKTADPQQDPRDVVQHIAELNNLSSLELQPGQRLVIPLPSP